MSGLDRRLEVRFRIRSIIAEMSIDTILRQHHAVTVPAGMDVHEAFGVLLENDVLAAPVHGGFVGVLALSDLVGFILQLYKEKDPGAMVRMKSFDSVKDLLCVFGGAVADVQRLSRSITPDVSTSLDAKLEADLERVETGGHKPSKQEKSPTSPSLALVRIFSQRVDDPLLAAVDLVAAGGWVGILDEDNRLVNTLTRQRLVALLAAECSMCPGVLSERPVFTGTLREWGFRAFQSRSLRYPWMDMPALVAFQMTPTIV